MANPYLPHTAEDIQQMLDAIEVSSVEELFAVIPPDHRCRHWDLPGGLSEHEVLTLMTARAARNRTDFVLFIGAGVYDHIIPPAVEALLMRGEWISAYTPYQPECSQGTLQALYEFQSMIASLFGMDAANASLYDGSTALAEAVWMALRLTKRRRLIVDEAVNPIHRRVLRSYVAPSGVILEEVPVDGLRTNRQMLRQKVNEQTAAVVLQNPNFFGVVDDLSDLSKLAHQKGALVIHSTYPAALGLLKPPGDCGADIAVAEGQCLGIPLQFGGPYLGLMACRKEFVRQMPGRIVGMTEDAQGRRCFVNTLQAREQHIRRHKATSNICTNVALSAIRAAVFMSLIGKEGLKQWALANFKKACYLKHRLASCSGVRVSEDPCFNEFVVAWDADVKAVSRLLLKEGIAAGFPLERYYPALSRHMLVTVTEKRTKEECDRYAAMVPEILKRLRQNTPKEAVTP